MRMMKMRVRVPLQEGKRQRKRARGEGGGAEGIRADPGVDLVADPGVDLVADLGVAMGVVDLQDLAPRKISLLDVGRQSLAHLHNSPVLHLLALRLILLAFLNVSRYM